MLDEAVDIEFLNILHFVTKLLIIFIYLLVLILSIIIIFLLYTIHHQFSYYL